MLANLTGAERNGNTPVYHASFHGPFGSAEFLPTTHKSHATSTPIACEDIVCHISSRYAWLL